MRIFLVNDGSQIAAVVENHVERLAIGPENCLLDTPVVFLECFTFPRENGDPLSSESRRSVILRREDVAARPANRCSQFNQRFYQHRRLNCHMKAARDTGPGERSRGPKLRTQRHQSRHLRFGYLNFFSAELG